MTSFRKRDSNQRALLATGCGTGLSLFGDSALYTVLPTHTDETRVSVGDLGILLAANRLIRLFLNRPAGLLCDRFSRRLIFLIALAIGACSTGMYALSEGFWSLLGARLLWGLAWSGIWVAGNAIILDISHAANRGRLTGVYQIAFFFGVSAGSVLGGFLTDRLGYRPTMGLGSLLSFGGLFIAAFLLPKRDFLKRKRMDLSPADSANTVMRKGEIRELAGAAMLLVIPRLVLAGLFFPTLALFLKENPDWSFAGRDLDPGVSTLTGILMGVNNLVAMLSAPLGGRLSDRLTNRWLVATTALFCGAVGFAVLISGSFEAICLGIVLTALAGGCCSGLATALIGDLGRNMQGRRLGFLFTTGDLAAAVGPLLAYLMMDFTGISTIYYLCAGIFACGFFLALHKKHA